MACAPTPPFHDVDRRGRSFHGEAQDTRQKRPTARKPTSPTPPRHLHHLPHRARAQAYKEVRRYLPWSRCFCSPPPRAAQPADRRFRNDQHRSAGLELGAGQCHPHLFPPSSFPFTLPRLAPVPMVRYCLRPPGRDFMCRGKFMSDLYSVGGFTVAILPVDITGLVGVSKSGCLPVCGYRTRNHEIGRQILAPFSQFPRTDA